MHAPKSAVKEYAARARVATDDPSRYLMQLCKHFRGKLPVEFDAAHGTITVGAARCSLDAEDGALVIAITAPAPEEVSRLQFMVAKHLAKFDRHDRLVLHWADA